MTASAPLPDSPRLPRRVALLAPLALAACAGPARAQRGLPDFADLAERVLPAVVSIQVTSRESAGGELRGGPAERGRRGQLVQGAGSGFIIEPQGIIVTNGHVVGNATRVTVTTQDGTDYPARVIGADELTDIALLRITPRAPLAAVSLGISANMRVGQWVMAAAPVRARRVDHQRDHLGARARHRAGPFDDFIQTDAPINPAIRAGRCSTWPAR